MGIFTDVRHIPASSYQASLQPKSNGRELSRLITAAVVNQGFCNMLLANPDRALACGYKGENFALTTEDQDLIRSIRAGSLAEFASQLASRQNGNGHGRKM